MGVCRILAITPYEGMKNMLVNLCRNRSDVQLTALVGDLEEGAKLVRENAFEDYDIIISRGGTAKVIREITNIPVVEISLSSYDVLSAIKLTENCAGKYAIVAYPNISSIAELLCDVLQYNIPIYTINDTASLKKTIAELGKKGFTLIIGDVVTTNYAKSCSLDAILITSGVESIEATIKQALRLYEICLQKKIHIHYMNLLSKFQKQDYAVLDTSGSLLWATDTISHNFVLQQLILKAFPTVAATGTKQFAKKFENEILSISGKTMEVHGNQYQAYTISHVQSIPEPHFDCITIKNQEDISKHYFKNYVNSALHEKISKYAKTNTPVLILGEISTNKDKVANALYVNSTFRENPFYIIDCQKAGNKFWNSLLSREDSILNCKNVTFYFKDTGSLSQEQVKSLFSYLEYVAGQHLNRFIFSVVIDEDTEEEHPICKYLKEKMSCLVIQLLPLRERINEIPALSSLYLNEFNTEFSKQVIGFEPEAMALLQGYRWPGNLGQFKRIMRGIVIMTDKPYISQDIVAQQLKSEETFSRSSNNVGSFDVYRPLDDMIFDIAKIVLKQENMNQTSAAKRLGISRTTLWRILRR